MGGGKTDPFIYLCNLKRAEKLVELIFTSHYH